MNSIEKLLEGMRQKQIDKFIEDTKLIPKSMHGSRKNHNTTAEKLEIDKDICKQRDNGRKVGVINTDPTVAYETVSHFLRQIPSEIWKLLTNRTPQPL